MVEDNESEIFIKAAEKIIEIYNKNKNNEKLKEMLENERNVIDEWSEIFNLNNIDNIPESALSFFDKENNHHWPLSRQKSNINFEQFKEGLKILLDESKDVSERLETAINKVDHFDKGMATPILLVHNVEKYGVWNNKSQKALRHLNLWKWGNGSDKKNYSEINETLIKLRDKVREINSDPNFDLWKLDAVLYMMKDEPKKDDEISKESHWWIEKTYEFRHDKVQGLENAEFSKSLWSPQTSKNGGDIYKNMRSIKPNDLIIHLVLDKNNSFLGISKAALMYKEVTMTSPDGPVKGYQVELKEYKPLEKPIKWDEIKEKYKEKLMEIRENNSNLFYNYKLQLNQAHYITEAPLEFVKLLNEIYKNSTNHPLPYFDDNPPNNEAKSSEVPNIILHGPVGTGKTYISNVLAQKIVDNEISTINDIEETIKHPISNKDTSDEKYKKTIKRITFHKSYSYEDFIAGIKAVSENGTISYQVEDGIFKEFCDEAKNHLGQNYVFIIDEINRGDISRIFGELITLIEEDKRGKWIINLPFKRDGEALNFLVPSNLYIIGTMNDSDRNIALIDVALRRRFTFFRIGFNEDPLSEWLNGLGDEFSNKIKEFVKYLNKQIKSRIGQDYEIGHAFFAPHKDRNSGDAKDEVYTIFKYKIFPLLEEYFHSDREVLIEFLKKFYKSEPLGKNDRIPIIEPPEFKNFDELMNLIDATLKNGQ